MELVNYRITLDVLKNGVQKTLQGFNTGDAYARRIEVSLVRGSELFELTDNLVASMYVKHEDAEEPSINACEIIGNKVIYNILPTDISSEGIVSMQLKIIEVKDDISKVLVSPRFELAVWDAITDDSEAEKTTVYTALEEALAEAKRFKDKTVVSVIVDEDYLFIVTFGDGSQYTSTVIQDAMKDISSVAEYVAEAKEAAETATSAEAIATEKATAASTSATEAEASKQYIIDHRDELKGEPGVIWKTEEPTLPEERVPIWINPNGQFVPIPTGGGAGIDDEVIATDKTWSSSKINSFKSEFVGTDNVKTINGQSIIGKGNIEIQGGGGGTELEYVKPLTEAWFIADNSPYVLDARNELETYWNDAYATRCGGASAYLYSKYDALANSGYCTKKQLTTVTSNGTTFPINAYEFSYANWWIGGKENYYVNKITDNAERFYNKPKIMLTSGVHGNERFTPVALYEFMKRVCTDKRYVKIRSAFDFYIIPIVNPTGIDADVRRNYQDIDINRDGDNKATEEMRAIQTYVKELTNNGESKLLWYCDFHQAPTNDDVMSCFMTMQNGDVDEFFFSRFVSSGQEALKEIREYIGATDTESQRVYSWKGSTLATIRNWVANYSEFASCWECSHYERPYTKSGIRNNPTASLIHNSLLDITCRCIIDADLVGIKYFGTDVPITISLTSISATKTKTVYDVDETLNVDDISVVATYSDGHTTNPTDFTTNASDIDMSTEGVKSLLVSYTDGVTKNATILLNVQGSGSTSLPVYATIPNITISASGALATSTSGTKQTLVYEVKPNTTYSVTCNGKLTDAKNCNIGGLATYKTSSGQKLTNTLSKDVTTSGASATFDYTTASDANFLYVYQFDCCDINGGLGFTVVEA